MTFIDEFTPFLAFPPEVRRVICTTDEIVKRYCGCRAVSGLPVGDEDFVGVLGAPGCGRFLVPLCFVVVGRAGLVPAP